MKRPATAFLKKLTLLVIVVGLSAAVAAPAAAQMTEQQRSIYAMVMAADGYLTEGMHRLFWADAPLGDDYGSPEVKALFEVMNKLTLEAQQLQVAIWQSALESYDAEKIVRRPGIGEATARIGEILAKRPKEFPPEAWEAFVAQYRASSKSGEGEIDVVLEAAADHGEIPYPQGGALKLTREHIQTILGNLEKSFGRVKRLMNPVWTEEN